jgi:hypothetical protein
VAWRAVWYEGLCQPEKLFYAQLSRKALIEIQATTRNGARPNHKRKDYEKKRLFKGGCMRHFFLLLRAHTWNA